MKQTKRDLLILAYQISTEPTVKSLLKRVCADSKGPKPNGILSKVDWKSTFLSGAALAKRLLTKLEKDLDEGRGEEALKDFRKEWTKKIGIP